MQPSSRTPDGKDGFCKICGQRVRISPSLSAGDATCPSCGTLLWFDMAVSSSSVPNLLKDISGSPGMAELVAARDTLMKAVSLCPSNETYRRLLDTVDSHIASRGIE